MRTSVLNTGIPIDITPERGSIGGTTPGGVMCVGEVASVRPYIGWMRVPVRACHSASTPGGVGAPPV